MIILILIVLGLCLGSFINAYVWRLHSKTKTGKYSKLSIWHGRSICPNCNHILSPLDLIPILSWIILRGKCRYCKKPISIQYPLVELITSILFIFSFLYWPYQFNKEGIILFSFWLIFLLGFIILTIYDLRWKILPNNIIFPLVILALFQIILKLVFFNFGYSLIFGSLWGILFSAGLFYGIFIVSNGKWIGGGDVKLAIVLGLLLGGPIEAILMVFISALIGTLISLVIMIMGKYKQGTTIAFGPMLMSATIICYLFGPQIINWYKSLILR